MIDVNLKKNGVFQVWFYVTFPNLSTFKNCFSEINPVGVREDHPSSKSYGLTIQKQK